MTPVLFSQDPEEKGRDQRLEEVAKEASRLQEAYLWQYWGFWKTIFQIIPLKFSTVKAFMKAPSFSICQLESWKLELEGQTIRHEKYPTIYARIVYKLQLYKKEYTPTFFDKQKYHWVPEAWITIKDMGSHVETGLNDYWFLSDPKGQGLSAEYQFVISASKNLIDYESIFRELYPILKADLTHLLEQQAHEANKTIARVGLNRLEFS